MEARVNNEIGLAHLLQRVVEVLFVLRGNPQEENLTGVLQQGDDTEEYQHSNEQGTDGVCDQPPKLPDEDGGYDDPHATQGVSQDVEKDTWQDAEGKDQ